MLPNPANNPLLRAGRKSENLTLIPGKISTYLEVMFCCCFRTLSRSLILMLCSYFKGLARLTSVYPLLLIVTFLTSCNDDDRFYLDLTWWMLRSDFPGCPDSRVVCGAVAGTPRCGNCLAWPGLLWLAAILGWLGWLGLHWL